VNILCVIDSLGSGGAQKQIVSLACGLHAKGYKVDILLYHPGQDHFKNEVSKTGVAVYEVPRKNSGFSLSVFLQLRERIASGYDCVISFQSTANIYSAFARFLIPNTKLIACERNSSISLYTPLRRFLSWIALFMSDHVVANSFYNAKYLNGLPGLTHKTVAIWNGYSVNPINVTKYKSNIDNILVVGRVSKQKNGLLLLEALLIFYQRHGWVPKVKWVGRKDSDKDSISIQSQMDDFLEQNSEISRKWSWEGEVDDVQVYYETSDVLILPSLFEGLPNVVCEAMIAGCPVIASNVCDHPILLGEKQERGLLCEPTNIESICNAIENMNDMSPKIKYEMTRNARKYAEGNLNIERMIGKYEQLILSS